MYEEQDEKMDRPPGQVYQEMEALRKGVIMLDNQLDGLQSHLTLLMTSGIETATRDHNTPAVVDPERSVLAKDVFDVRMHVQRLIDRVEDINNRIQV